MFLGVKAAQVASTLQGMLITVFVRFFILYLSFFIINAGRPPVLPSGLAWGLLITLNSSSKSARSCSSVKPGLILNSSMKLKNI